MSQIEEAKEELANYVFFQCKDWAQAFIDGRRNFLRSRGIKASDNLIRSLEFEVINELQGEVMTRVEIAFEEYGRFIDQKALKTAKGGEDHIAGIKKWIIAKGLEAKMIQGYMRKRGLKTMPKGLDSIAWGIVVKRTMTYKRQAWWNKAKSAAITDLYNNIAAGLPDIVAEGVKKAFKNQA